MKENKILTNINSPKLDFSSKQKCLLKKYSSQVFIPTQFPIESPQQFLKEQTSLVNNGSFICRNVQQSESTQIYKRKSINYHNKRIKQITENQLSQQEENKNSLHLQELKKINSNSNIVQMQCIPSPPKIIKIQKQFLRKNKSFQQSQQEKQNKATFKRKKTKSMNNAQCEFQICDNCQKNFIRSKSLVHNQSQNLQSNNQSQNQKIMNNNIKVSILLNGKSNEESSCQQDQKLLNKYFKCKIAKNNQKFISNREIKSSHYYKKSKIKQFQTENTEDDLSHRKLKALKINQNQTQISKRRDEIGLSFLNDLDSQQIFQRIQKEKNKLIQKTKLKYKQSKQDDKEITQYMKNKKQLIKQSFQIKNREKENKQNHIKENLQKLKQYISKGKPKKQNQNNRQNVIDPLQQKQNSKLKLDELYMDYKNIKKEQRQKQFQLPLKNLEINDMEVLPSFSYRYNNQQNYIIPTMKIQNFYNKNYEKTNLVQKNFQQSEQDFEDPSQDLIEKDKNRAALIIQTFLRGFQVRKLVKNYVSMLKNNDKSLLLDEQIYNMTSDSNKQKSSSQKTTSDKINLSNSNKAQSSIEKNTSEINLDMFDEENCQNIKKFTGEKDDSCSQQQNFQEISAFVIESQQQLPIQHQILLKNSEKNETPNHLSQKYDTCFPKGNLISSSPTNNSISLTNDKLHSILSQELINNLQKIQQSSQKEEENQKQRGEEIQTETKQNSQQNSQQITFKSQFTNKEIKMPQSKEEFVKTNLSFINSYCQQLIALINQNEQFFLNFISNFTSLRNIPFCQKFYLIKFNDKFLKQLELEVAQQNNVDNEVDFNQQMLSIEVYKVHQEIQDNLQNFGDENISDMQKIHNLMVFESFNEALEQIKLKLNEKQQISKLIKLGIQDFNNFKKTINFILNQARLKVIEWGTSLCGFMLDKKMDDIPQFNLDDISEDSLLQIREERMVKVINKEIQQNEDSKQCFKENNDIFEIKLDISDYIFDLLVHEMAQEIQQFNAI